jgi:hypothetical protein
VFSSKLGNAIESELIMSKKHWHSFLIVPLSILISALAGCGGAGPTPLNGTTVMPAISISLSPETVTLVPGGAQTFNATGNNATNAGVGWTVNGITGGNSTIGTIDQLGNYSAPISPPNPATVTVSAVAQVDNSEAANATVTIQGASVPVTVTISPASTTTYVGQPLVFTATVTGASNTSVSWQVNGQPLSSANPSWGAIVPVAGSQDAVTYTAPAQVPSPAQVTITAVSVAYPSQTASATVTISKLPTKTGLSLTGPSSTVFVGQPCSFTAVAVGLSSASVIWQVDGITGGNSSVGTIVGGQPVGDVSTATYTEPDVSGPTQITITAVSVAEASDFASVVITVTVVPPNADVTISPASATVFLGQPLLFTASVTGATDTAVTWLLNGEPPNSQNTNLGTLTTVSPSEATYTGPLQLPGTPTVTITAVSVANPDKFDSATVTLAVASGSAVVTVSPTGATLYPGVTQTFTATVTGETNTSVSWQVDGIPNGNSTLGTIQAGAGNSATYTPPAQVTTAFSVTVTAVSTASPSAFGSATVNLTPPPPPITVSVLPSSADVVVSTTQQYTATVTNAENPTVTWQVNNIPGGNIATVGSIDGTGLYTAPAAIPSGTITIQAVSSQTPTIIGTATAVIESAPVTVVALTPPSVTVQVGLGQQFTATVTGTTDPAVNFAVNGEVGGDSTIGTISADGPPVGNVTTALYLAPATVPAPATVQITAVSAFDGTTSAPATVTIDPAPQIQVTVAPSSQTLITGQTQTFAATVTNTTDQLVSWGISGPSCSGLTCGTIASTGSLTANYIAPQNVPSPNPTVTVTATADASSTAQGTAVVTVEPATPTISIQPGSWTIEVGTDNTVNFSAIIENAPADTPVVWGIGCISLYDGTAGEACRDVDFSGGGPGCISLPGLTKVCSNQPLPATAGNEALTYYAPQALSTVAFQENACQPTNQGIAQVPLTATMAVGGTQYVAQTVCITVTQ